MALSEFRDTHSWQGAIELGPHIVRLAEDLPTAEAMGLSLQLRQSMVELPAAIAVDLLEGHSFTRKPAIMRLVAMLDLIDKIYPALDTAELRTTVEQLAERLSGKDFGEQTAGAARAYLPGASSAAESAAATEAHLAADASAADPAPAASPAEHDAPTADAMASPAADPTPATHIQVTPAGEVVSEDQ